MVKRLVLADTETGAFDGEVEQHLKDTIAPAAGERLVYWDDFSRPNGTLGVAPTGQTYEVTGAGTGRIVGGDFVATEPGTTYAGIPINGVARVGVKFRLLTTGGATASVAIAFGNGPNVAGLISDSGHFIVVRDKAAFQTRIGNTLGQYRDVFLDTPLANNSIHTWEIIRAEDGTLTYLLDGKVLDTYQADGIDAQIGNATYLFIEPTRSTVAGGDETQILEAWAFEPAEPDYQPPQRTRSGIGRLWSRITSDSPVLAGLDLIARKGTAMAVRIGRGISGNVPAIVFNEAVDIYGSGTSVRTGGSVYASAGTSNQVIIGGVSGGGGFAIGSSSDVLLRRVFANVLALGADDGFRTGTFTTAGRPSAPAFGAGTMIYDTDLKKPLWSDGTVWRDAAGTAV